MPLPVAWLISEGTTAETYEHFFKAISSCAGNLSRYYASAVMGDYDTALQSAVATVWPTAQYCGDYFHFLQANTRWFKKHCNSKDDRQHLIKMLQILYYSPTTAVFMSNKDQFLRYWIANNLFYARYFYSTWIRKIPPVKWMMIAHGLLGSGDQVLEGYNNRLKRVGKYILFSLF